MRLRYWRNKGRFQSCLLSMASIVLISFSPHITRAQLSQSHLSPDAPRSVSRAGSNAQPAAVRFKDGLLTVEANNSGLIQILDDVSRQSGMLIEGPVRDARVYGIYGPGSASSILSELLEGMDYNVIIVGGADGSAPKRLILSNRTGGPSPPPHPNTTIAEGVDRIQKNNQQRNDEPEFAPGAIAHPAPAAPADQRVRTEQNMQRLQQMRNLLTKPATSR